MNPKTRTIDHLAAAIRKLHGGEPRWVESHFVREGFEGQAVWEAEVEVFDLLRHPSATRCYAWITPAKPSPRTYAVLHAPPVDSPVAAVRAAVVRDYRATQ